MGTHRLRKKTPRRQTYLHKWRAEKDQRKRLVIHRVYLRDTYMHTGRVWGGCETIWIPAPLGRRHRII